MASGLLGISPRVFIAQVVWPLLLTTLEISREEMKSALRKRVTTNLD